VSSGLEQDNLRSNLSWLRLVVVKTLYVNGRCDWLADSMSLNQWYVSTVGSNKTQLSAHIFVNFGQTKLDGISRGGKMVRHSGLFEFHSCTLCHKASHHKLFAYVTYLELAFEILFFQFLSTIHDHRWGSEERPI